MFQRRELEGTREGSRREGRFPRTFFFKARGESGQIFPYRQKIIQGKEDARQISQRGRFSIFFFFFTSL